MTDDLPSSDAAAARANTFPWPPVLLAIALAASWALGWALPLAWPGLDDAASHVAGIAFGIAGIALVMMAIRALAKHNTTVMPDKASTTLVTTGPYAMFRNPIYLGEILILLCIADWTRNFWFVISAIAFAISVTALQILPEERHLAARFGDAYTEYKIRTRRWI